MGKQFLTHAILATFVYPHRPHGAVVGPDGVTRYMYSKSIDLAAGPGAPRQLGDDVLHPDVKAAMMRDKAFVMGDQSLTGGEIFHGGDVLNYGGGASGAWGTEASAGAGGKAGSVEWLARAPKSSEARDPVVKAKLEDIERRLASTDPAVKKQAQHELT